MKNKVTPNSRNLERLVLGAMLIDVNAVNTCIELITDIELLYDPRHKIIFTSIIELHRKGFDVDIVTVSEDLTTQGLVEKAGGVPYVAELAMSVNSALHLESHIRKLQEAHIKRIIIEVSEQLITAAFDGATDAFEALAQAQGEMLRIAEMIDHKGERSMQQIVNECLTDLQAKAKLKGLTGVPSAIRAVNNLTGGYQDSSLVILAARPAMGKTAYAINEARNAAINYNIPVGVFSLEMSRTELGYRLIKSETRIDSDSIKRPATMSDANWNTLSTKLAKLHGCPMYVDDTASLTIMQLRAKAAKMKAKYGIRLFVVDYIQLLRNPMYKNNREQEIASIARELKLMAKDLKVPVIALSQLSRAVETRGGDRRPQLSDLRESGAIEQDADIVTFLYRPEYYGIEEDENGNSTAGLTELIYAKHRNGGLDNIFVEHNLPLNLYSDLGDRYTYPESDFNTPPPMVQVIDYTRPINDQN